VPYQHGWLYLQGGDGVAHEIVNHARTTAYLSGVTFDNGLAICDVLADGGCPGYAYDPPCGYHEGWFDIPGPIGGAGNPPIIQTTSVDPDFNVTGAEVLTVEARISPVDWTPTPGARTIIGRRELTGNQQSWTFDLSFTGGLLVTLSANGSTSSTYQSPSLIPTPAVGEWRWVRFEYTPGGPGVRHLAFAYSADNRRTWASLGALEPTESSLAASTAPMQLAAYDGDNSATPWLGRISDAVVYADHAVVFALRTTDFTVPDADGMMTSSGHAVAIDGTSVTVVSNAVVDWRPLDFTSPAIDLAPWYTSLYPESADAFGFWIEEWTGLDDAHIVRPVTSFGSAWGGAQLGTIRANERVMKLNVLLFGRNEAASEYLFRWLATTLSANCTGCAVDSMLIRRVCPTGGDFDQGVARLDEVGLVEGLQWETDPTTHSMCSVRRVSFGLTAGDPCLYVDQTDEVLPSATANAVNCLNAAVLAPGRRPCRPSCRELTANCRTVVDFAHESLGVAGPVVEFVNDWDEHALAVRAVVYADPTGVGVSPNPCGLPILGEIYLQPLPPSSTLIWDVNRRRVLYHDPGTGTFVPGWAYVSANDHPYRRSFSLPCTSIHLVMEPANFCLDHFAGPPEGWSDGSFNFYTPHFPAVTVSVGERLGCV
jgi:hypothetical protein